MNIKKTASLTLGLAAALTLAACQSNPNYGYYPQQPYPQPGYGQYQQPGYPAQQPQAQPQQQYGVQYPGKWLLQTVVWLGDVSVGARSSELWVLNAWGSSAC